MLGKTKVIVWVVAVTGVMILGLFNPGKPSVLAQQPTGSIPTVTSTPSGAMFTVDQSIPIVRIYAGPGS
ncbi:MAG TPA: hypothetical protein VHP14_26715, partial [Anaerolineales bacterium]|nr:hypothetical protein [Anaerolineales bacterium]